ncbi:hypothetical protein NZK32_12635 [Cyanobium sp. FGCU-52]|nr:hypothetical protein [Cyanobium sp. FGCU52]
MALSDSGPRSSAVMARLSLSAIGRGAEQPGFWAEPAVHRALLITGLSVLVSGLNQLSDDLG